MGTNGTDGRSCAQQALAGWQDDGTAYLQSLDDSAFLVQWSAVRYRLALDVPSKPGPECGSTLKHLYQAMADDYRRRAGVWANASRSEGCSR